LDPAEAPPEPLELLPQPAARSARTETAPAADHARHRRCGPTAVRTGADAGERCVAVDLRLSISLSSDENC
jgi:hypothetical protein